MHKHMAHISWSRKGDAFVDRRYSRVHEWRFDGGARFSASASPFNVPAPYSSTEAVDPEEAFVAAVSSCHMLWFLSIAARGGFVVDRYDDEAHGVIDRTPAGKLAFTRITLSPRIEFVGARQPTDEEVDAMHRDAHSECFIANSLTCEVVIAVGSRPKDGL